LSLIFASKYDYNTFHELSKEIGLVERRPVKVPIVASRIVARDTLALYRQWLDLLDWAVAFQLESMTLNFVLDVKEMLSLQSRVSALLLERGPKKMVTFLRHFATEMEPHKPDIGHRNEQTETIEQCFDRLAKDYKPRIVSRYDRISGDVFDCFHVTVRFVQLSRSRH
jgi:hypothetical protein